uniref:Sulfatase N-terminal domain-containing protein n=1 Tax=Panagrolaimus davidi TaxID=227884 RepID=A0A914PF47_9BILA
MPEGLFTPNLRKYAFSKGTAHLTNSYVTPLCTSTRSSLMTGMYPFKTGTQHGVFLPMERSAVPLEYPFLPQNLKRIGYKNYLIGKWHLGYCKKEYLPTKRGFDYFYGYYNAQEGYFNHSTAFFDKNTNALVSGLDLFAEVDGVSVPDRTKNGIYATHLYTAEAIRQLQKHDRRKPFFMFFSHQSVHAPLQVPPQYRIFCNPLIMSRWRQVYCGMLAAMDESFGLLMEYLKDSGYYNNTIVIFSSDNGGDPKAGASNFPLKGQKSTIWEGGTRTTTFIHAPKSIKGFVYRRELFHVVDWHATILGMAGLTLDIYGDGINQWDLIKTGIPKSQERTKFVYSLDPPIFAIRHNNYKLIYESSNEFYLGDGKVWLYQISTDPYESKNLSRKHPKLVKELLRKIFEYQRFARKPVRTIIDEAGNPSNFNGVYASGWCE